MKKLILCAVLLFSQQCFAETGIASWYSTKTNGTRTASGEKLNDSGLTCAHRTLKFGTKVKITNLRNKKTVIVKVTNRGPFIKGRIVDVSVVAARELGFYKNGITKVKIEVLK